jgi:hypothetical protein
MTFVDRVSDLDTSLFGEIESQTTETDRPRPHHAFQMPDSVFVVELGPTRLWDTPYVLQALVPIA